MQYSYLGNTVQNSFKQLDTKLGVSIAQIDKKGKRKSDSIFKDDDKHRLKISARKERMSKEDGLDGSARISKCEEDEVHVSYKGNSREDSFEQMDTEPVVIIAQTAAEGNTDNVLKDEGKLKGKVNESFMLDQDDVTAQTVKPKSADSDTSIKIERQRSVSLNGAVTRKNDSVKLSGSSKKTRTTPFSDPVFRIKLLKTGFLLWNMTILGWEYGQLGPIFPDLQDIAGVSLKQGSWFFTGNAIGYLAGCLLAGLTQKRFVLI